MVVSKSKFEVPSARSEGVMAQGQDGWRKSEIPTACDWNW